MSDKRIPERHGHCKTCGACVPLPTQAEIDDMMERSKELAGSNSVELCLICDTCVLAYRIRMQLIAQRN